MTGDVPEFVKVAELAARWRVPKMAIYRLVWSGELASVRVGRTIRIPEAAVTEYLEAG